MNKSAKVVLVTVAVSAALIVPVAAETLTYKAPGIELEMQKGAFNSDDRRAQQLLTIKNRSTVAISSIIVECGFFHGDLLIGRGREYVTNLDPGQDGYADVHAYVLSADRTDCRFSDVNVAR